MLNSLILTRKKQLKLYQIKTKILIGTNKLLLITINYLKFNFEL